MARGRKTSLMITLTPDERQTLLAWQRSITYGQITRNRETLEYSWSPALLHQQSAQLHTLLRVEIQEPRCGATFPSHALYAPIFSELKVGVPTLLARMKQSHDAVGTPGFRVCRRDVGALFQITA